MTTADTLVYCPCCGKEKPSYDYPVGRHTCSNCCDLPGDSASLLTRETVRREQNVRQHTALGRKQARIEAKLAHYQAHGKRCTACHHLKPAGAYNKCAPMGDGLQPICRTCNELRVMICKREGITQWHAIRAALRASSPEGK